MATAVANFRVLPHRPAVPWAAAGVANGFPLLDATQKILAANLPDIPVENLPMIPTDKLPDSILSGLTYMGVWDASTTTAGDYAQGQLVFSMFPTLTMSEMGLQEEPTKGQYWRVSVASNGHYPQDLTGSPTDFAVGDYLVIESVSKDQNDYYTLTFSKVDNTETVSGVTLDGVVQTGTVVLDDAIGEAQLQDNSIGDTKLKTASVGTSTLKDNSVSTEKLAADSVTATEIAAGVVGGTHISAGSIGETHIQDSSVTSLKIPSGNIQGHHLGANALSASHLPTVWDANGRTKTWFVDNSMPVTELGVDEINYPDNAVNYPKSCMVYDELSAQNAFEVRRQNCEGDITVTLTQRVFVPDNFAGFKMSGGSLNLGLLLDINDDGGSCEVMMDSVQGFENTGNVVPFIPPQQAITSSPTNPFTTTPIADIGEPLDSMNQSLVPGQSFLVKIYIKLTGTGGVNQYVRYRALKYDYLYQV